MIAREMSMLDMKNFFGGSDYMGLNFLGVDPSMQGKGFGGQSLAVTSQLAQSVGVRLCLETERHKNVRIYEKYGLHVRASEVEEGGFWCFFMCSK
ncbi:hypothetical protein ADUPG1_001491 [Aduncisulcus paluster]|uniref:N-acetyltransferase domain-containing protein n=1 Tax=Aduncisulcus paluster TaxID=2918883 RepID=A0ABQ5KCU7_9EUKA|nr:hypothetical protein ADUPG1_001491 [Aduncisulcus paluster]